MQALTVKLSKKVVECSENQKCIQGLEPGQRTLLTKIFELEKQLSVLWHTLEKKEIEQNSIQEELAELKPVLVSAEVENKRLMEELEARQQEADKYQSRLEVVTQMQESMERAIEKVKQLEEAAVNISNYNSVSDLTCKAAVLDNQSYVEREYERRSDVGGICSQELLRGHRTSLAAKVPPVRRLPRGKVAATDTRLVQTDTTETTHDT